jgi:hypothetical protein
VKDLVLDPKLHLLTDPEVVIAKVAAPRLAAEIAAEEEAAAAAAEEREEAAVVEEEAGAAAPAPAEE